MKLSLENLSQNLSWKGYRLPQYDIQAARDYTKAHPVWLHFGAGNLFRAFPAVLAQRLLTARLSRAGVICCEGYDEELIDRCYRSCDHLSIVATVYPNGTVNKEVVASVTESLKMSEDEDFHQPRPADGVVHHHGKRLRPARRPAPFFTRGRSGYPARPASCFHVCRPHHGTVPRARPRRSCTSRAGFARQLPEQQPPAPPHDDRPRRWLARTRTHHAGGL